MKPLKQNNMSAPVRNSCPFIDKGIVEVGEIPFYLEHISKEICNYSINDIEGAIDNVLALVPNIINYFEEGRSINSDLRTYAEEQEDKIAALEKELEMVRTEMEDLEQELEEIRADYHV